MHPVFATATLVLLGATLSAFAADRSPMKSGHATELHRETSAAGESLDAFVVRIAPRARAASVSTRSVVCGEIMGSGPYTLALKTDGRQDWCEVPKTAAPYLLVNGIAKDAREDHIPAIYYRRPGYLITPWSIKFQDRSSVRKIAEGGR
ncbi:hypothetical protein ABFO19_09430 [Xanthomonas citri pv. glycines]|uniref:Lipoprotein n=1 Tax=Xanthomonas campestris pv. glycines TaxID=473421 RepID=A0AAX0I4V1_XANCG|nr:MULTISPECIES: hypothetical protein [Xanthomonas]AOY63378.1 hypothetical protein BHE84_15270 [Xanthomonas citri pv. glycines str. 8ra]ARV23307.1 hypothetical protein A9D66_12045 [Xanthomonas citri pv. glycines str. 12-2]EWC53085.1 hypothetical protein XAR_0525 [Xanthomonas citri pv. glycines str. 8ra]OEY98673.1 hypothetical protein BIY41_09915 [Xanthomonas citri pv. glycines]OOW98607.1 hypothetical protein Xgly_21790 [Xanthomonas citri pv. glycines]